MSKILIVDDHELLSDSLKFTLEAQGEEVLACIKDASLAELFCQKFMPDIVLMDILTVNNADGILATSKIKDRFPNIKVMILTGFDEAEYIHRAKQARADAFVYKGRPLNEILEEIKLCLSGKGSYPECDEEEVNVDNSLTNKELEVLQLICDGLPRKEIADKLYLSDNTIKTHITHLFEKTGCKSKSQLAIYAIANGIIKK